MIDLILISFFFLSALFDVLWCVLMFFPLMVIVLRIVLFRNKNQFLRQILVWFFSPLIINEL